MSVCTLGLPLYLIYSYCASALWWGTDVLYSVVFNARL